MFKKISALLCLTLSIVLFCMAVSATETESESTETIDIDAIYVSGTATEGGTGVVDAPVSTLSEAYELLGNEGTIYLMDTVEVSATLGNCFIAPTHTGKITITSAEGYTGVLDLTEIEHYHFGGETDWNGIEIIACDVVLTADNHTVTMGAGLEMSSPEEDVYRAGHTYSGAKIHLAAYAPCETADAICEAAGGRLNVHSGEYWSVSAWYGSEVSIDGGETQIYLGATNENDSIRVRYLCPGLFGAAMDQPLTANASAVIVTTDMGLSVTDVFRFTHNAFSGSLTVNWLMRESMQGSSVALIPHGFYPDEDAECTLNIHADGNSESAQSAVALMMLANSNGYSGDYSGEAQLSTSTHTHEMYTRYDGRILCRTCEYEQCRHLKTRVEITDATCTTKEIHTTYCDDICNIELSYRYVGATNPENHADYPLYYRYTNVYDFMAFRCKGCNERLGVLKRDTISDTIYMGEWGVEYTASYPLPTNGIPYFKDYYDAVDYLKVACNLLDELTIIVEGPMVIPTAIDLPAIGGHVRMIGVNDAVLVFDCYTRRIRANDDMTIENIRFAGGYFGLDEIVVCAQDHKLVMGEGITVQEGRKTVPVGEGEEEVELNAAQLYVIGGKAGGSGTIDADITVRSGKYRFVGGWNFNGSTCDGKAKMTIGKTNPEDTLYIEYLCPFSRGDGYITEQAETTMIIDGDVEVYRFYVTTLNLATENIPYVTNVVLKGNVNCADAIDLRGTADNDFYPETIVNLYTDSRVDSAVVDSYVFLGHPDGYYDRDTTLNTIDATVNAYSYEDYCATVLGGHADSDTDSLCDECGHVMSVAE